MVVVADEDWSFAAPWIRSESQGPQDVEVYTQLVTGSHSVHALCAAAGEVPLLRTELERLFLALGEQMRREMQMAKFRLASATAARPLGAAEDHAGSLVLAYTFERTIVLEGRFPVLKRFRFRPGQAGG
jgi:hypothetical protein